MPDEGYLNESLRKIAKGAGIGFTGTFIGMAFGYFSRMIIARIIEKDGVIHLIPQRPIEAMRGFIKGISAEEIRDEEPLKIAQSNKRKNQCLK